MRPPGSGSGHAPRAAATGAGSAGTGAGRGAVGFAAGLGAGFAAGFFAWGAVLRRACARARPGVASVAATDAPSRRRKPRLPPGREALLRGISGTSLAREN